MVTYSPIPTPVYISLWISAVVYAIVGPLYFFQVLPNFSPSWVIDNGFKKMMYHTFSSGMGVGILVLTYVSIDALIAGEITTLEIEIEMLTVSMFAGMVFKASMPGKLAIIVPFTKPECYLTAVMLFCAYDLVRWPALMISIGMVVYGVLMAVFKPFIQPNTIDQLIKDMKSAGEVEAAEKIMKMVPPPPEAV